MYTELAPKLTATASVAQSVERWFRDPGSRVRFPAGGRGFFVTGPGWVLKGNSTPKPSCIHMKHLTSISLILKYYSVVIFS